LAKIGKKGLSVIIACGEAQVAPAYICGEGAT
jgi:hypothetical protein